MFVLPQSSRCGDDIVVSDADINVSAVAAAAAVFIVIAEVAAKNTTR